MRLVLFLQGRLLAFGKRHEEAPANYIDLSFLCWFLSPAKNMGVLKLAKYCVRHRLGEPHPPDCVGNPRPRPLRRHPRGDPEPGAPPLPAPDAGGGAVFKDRGDTGIARGRPAVRGESEGAGRRCGTCRHPGDHQLPGGAECSGGRPRGPAAGHRPRLRPAPGSPGRQPGHGPGAGEGIPRWKKNVQWIRFDLVERGVMKKDSQRGVWELSESS